MSHVSTAPEYTGAKAIVGGVASGVLAALTALSVIVTGDATLADVTQGQWIVVLIAVITTTGLTGTAVYQTTNQPK